MGKDKIYKFECGTEENKNNWINCLNSELKKIKDKVERDRQRWRCRYLPIIFAPSAPPSKAVTKTHHSYRVKLERC